MLVHSDSPRKVITFYNFKLYKSPQTIFLGKSQVNATIITFRVRELLMRKPGRVRVSVMNWCIATFTKKSYECRAMQLRCLLWAGSVSMTESGNFDLRPWVPCSGFRDQRYIWVWSEILLKNEIIYKKPGATALFRDSHYFIGENRGRLVWRVKSTFDAI